jgi:hypothetical protein
MAYAIEADVYHDRVEIKMFGEKPIVIHKPVQISLNEWDAFWRRKLPRTPYTKTPFTSDDGVANNTRRLANLAAK